jgi:hypothetical protein
MQEQADMPIAERGEGPGRAPADKQSPSGKKVAVVGQGYVGLPLAMRAVEVGY